MNKRKSLDSADMDRLPLKTMKLSNNETKSPSPSTSKSDPPRASIKSSIGEIQAKLKHCVEVSEKLSKANVWENEIIDLYCLFVEHQDPQKTDYTFIGQCIEAVARAYGLRLDSLYEDTTRLSKSLGRRGIVDLKRLPNRAQENDEDQPESTPQRKKRRQVSTIAKNPESLNGKLITNPISDPFFTKLNTFVGETSRANRMLLNLLPAKRRGQLGFSLDVPFWDSSEQHNEETSKSIVSLKSNRCSSIANTSIRTSEFIVDNDDYRLITMMEISSDEEKAIDSDFDMVPDCLVHVESCFTQYTEAEDHGYGTALESTQGNISRFTSIDEPPINNHALKCLDLHSFDNSLTKPHESYQREYIEDFEPTDAQHLEYSYRSAELIRNYYAGPIHWKFIETKKLQETENIVSAKKKTKRSKEVSLECLRRLSDSFEESLHLTSKASRKLVLPLKKLNLWSVKNQTLPPDYQHPLNIFERFVYASFGIEEHIDDFITHQQDAELSQDESHFGDNEFEEQSNNEAEAVPFYNFNSTHVHRASSLTTKLKFSTKARKVNIKAIKDLSLSVIFNDSQADNEVKFSNVSKKVCKMFERSEETSCALTFLSILQATNEGKIDVEQEDDDIHDFLIHFRNN